MQQLRPHLSALPVLRSILPVQSALQIPSFIALHYTPSQRQNGRSNSHLLHRRCPRQCKSGRSGNTLKLIAAKVLSAILATAYKNSPDTAPSLVIVNSRSPSSFSETASVAPVADIDAHQFLSEEPAALATFLEKHTPGTEISEYHFLVADEQTIEDQTLLLTETGLMSNKPAEHVQTMRLSAEHANAIPVALGVATMDMEGLRDLVDEDGVYRGGRSNGGVIRGGPAPRKQLGSHQMTQG